MLEQFFKIIGVKDDSLMKEINGLEFNISPNFIEKIEILTQYFNNVFLTNQLNIFTFKEFN